MGAAPEDGVQGSPGGQHPHHGEGEGVPRGGEDRGLCQDVGGSWSSDDHCPWPDSGTEGTIDR